MRTQLHSVQHTLLWQRQLRGSCGHPACAETWVTQVSRTPGSSLSRFLLHLHLQPSCIWRMWHPEFTLLGNSILLCKVLHEWKDEGEVLDARCHSQRKDKTLHPRWTPQIPPWFLNSYSIRAETLLLTRVIQTRTGLGRTPQAPSPHTGLAAAWAWRGGWGRPGGPGSARSGSAARTATKASPGSASSKST